MLSQTAVSWVHVAHAHTACSCAALASAPLRDLFRGAFVMLNSLTSLLLLGVPPGPTLESMPATGQCAAVLTYLQLGLGLVAPALVQAALEAHLFRQHQAQRARQGLPPERGAHARLYAWVAAALSAAPEELLIVAAAWLGVCLLWSASLALSSLAAPGQ